jgi:hypothetical protein
MSICVNSASAAEPSLITVLTNLGFTNVELVTDVDVTFPPGVYNITLYAEFAGYHDGNELSYYGVGTTSYTVVFAGPEGDFGYLSPPISKTVSVDSPFGLSMYVADQGHRYFTQNSLNPDGKNHSRVYRNLNDPTMYLVGLENLYGAGDRDYQDLVFSIQLQRPINVVPEVPFGTIATTMCMILALAGFVGFKRHQFGVRKH